MKPSFNIFRIIFQTSTIGKMGAQNSNQINCCIAKGWKLRQKTETCSIYRHSISQDLCQRTIIYGVEQKQIDMYEQRKAYSYIYNPTVYSYTILRDPKNNKFISQGWTLDAEVLVETVDSKLSQFDPLSYSTFEVGFWNKRLEQVFLGFQYLLHTYGPFKINSDMIGWTHDRAIKTWINSDFSRNECQKGDQSEKTMVNDLKCIFGSIFENKMQGIHKFEESIRFLKGFFGDNQRSQILMNNSNSISMVSIQSKLRRTIQNSIQVNPKVNFSYQNNLFDMSHHNSSAAQKTNSSWHFNQSKEYSTVPPNRYTTNMCQTQDNFFYKSNKTIRKQVDFLNRKINSNRHVHINPGKDTSKHNLSNNINQFRHIETNKKDRTLQGSKNNIKKNYCMPIRREISQTKNYESKNDTQYGKNESLNQSNNFEIRNTMDSVNFSSKKPSSSTNYNSERMSSFNSKRELVIKNNISEAIKKEDFSSSCRIKLQFNQNKNKCSREKYLYRSTKNPHCSIDKRPNLFEGYEKQDSLIKNLIKSNHFRQYSYETFDLSSVTPKCTTQIKGFQKISKNMLLLKQSKFKQLQQKLNDHEQLIELIDSKQMCVVKQVPESTDKISWSQKQNKNWTFDLNKVRSKVSNQQFTFKKNSQNKLVMNKPQLQEITTSMKLVQNADIDHIKEDQQNIENQFDALFSSEEPTQNSQVSFDDLRYQIADILS